MSTPAQRLAALVDEERHARNRLALFRARLYGGDRPNSILEDRRHLEELDREWKSAAQRLRAERSRDQ